MSKTSRVNRQRLMISMLCLTRGADAGLLRYNDRLKRSNGNPPNLPRLYKLRQPPSNRIASLLRALGVGNTSRMIERVLALFGLGINSGSAAEFPKTHPLKSVSQ
jgi:hypothetical protein